jgi:hypothetical protein
MATGMATDEIDTEIEATAATAIATVVSAI